MKLLFQLTVHPFKPQLTHNLLRGDVLRVAPGSNADTIIFFKSISQHAPRRFGDIPFVLVFGADKPAVPF